MVSEVQPVRAGMRAGVWALVFGAVALAWLGAAVGLAVWAMSDAAPAPVGVIAYIMVLTGFFVVPVLGLAAIVTGVVALVRDRVAGKVLGGIGLFLGLCLCVIVVSLVLGSDGILGAISF